MKTVQKLLVIAACITSVALFGAGIGAACAGLELSQIPTGVITTAMYFMTHAFLMLLIASDDH